MVVKGQSEAIHWMPTSRGTGVDWRILVALGLSLTIVLLTLSGSLRPLFGVALLVLQFVLLAAGFAWARKHGRDWQREIGLAMLRSPDDARQVLRKRWGYRLFMPARVVRAQRGVIASAAGEASVAEKFLERAWIQTPPDERGALLGPLVRSKASLREWADVRVLARDWVDRSMTPDVPEIFLAASLMDLGDPDSRKQAARLVEEKDVPGDPLSAELLRRVQRALGA